MKSSLSKIQHALAAFLLVLTSGVSQADDTDIFFNTGGKEASALTPNLLLILDTSSSMENRVTDPTDRFPPSRIAVLKEAVRDIITGVDNMNIGLMRFTRRDGGPVLFPVQFIDAEVSDFPSESGSAFSAVITDATNDAEQELTGNTVDLYDTVLSVGTVVIPGSSVSGGSVTITSEIESEEVVRNGNNTLDSQDLDFGATVQSGIQFNDTNIPENANLTLAELDLYVKNPGGGPTTMRICADDVDDAASLRSGRGSYLISNRLANCTSNNVVWPIPEFSSGTPKKITRSILPIMEELVQRNCDNPGVSTDTDGCSFGDSGNTPEGFSDEIVLLFDHLSGNGNREICTEEARVCTRPANKRAVLRVNWDGEVTAPTPVESMTGLRFENVRIPQGATINSASLIFTPDGDTITSFVTTNMTIKAEAIDNSPAFKGKANNIGKRTLTTATAAWNNVSPWAADIPEETPATIDFKSVVQEVVNRPGWCGGNAMTFVIQTDAGLRDFISADQSLAQSVQFNYDYDTSSTGCNSQTELVSVSVPDDDADENGRIVSVQGDLDMKRPFLVGLRFQGVDIPQGSTIQSAGITFRADESDSGAARIIIKGEKSPDAARYDAVDGNIENRTPTEKSVAWIPKRWVATFSYTTDDLSDIVQEIVDQTGWVSGNSMGFLFDAANSNERVAESNDSLPSGRPRLSITYTSSTAPTPKTVRDRLLEIVDQLPASDSTPIVETLYEAARYWTGGPVNYGKSRENGETNRISHAASYCTAVGQCNGADVSDPTIPTDQYGVFSPADCVDLDSFACRSRQIYGSPNYISPFSSELSCQKNYQVLLTDGAANSLDTQAIDDISKEYLNNAPCAQRNSAGRAYSAGEKCGADLAEYLFENDLSATLANNQNVTTYTLAFNLNDAGPVRFLKDIAVKGSGSEDGFYQANTASELLNIFQAIFAEVVDDPTAFVAPALATNQFESLETRDTLYFGMFTPELSQRWFGNVKKYRICINPDPDGVPASGDECDFGDILDATGASALDPNGKIKATARSLWTLPTVDDGSLTLKGGAGSVLDDYTKRVIYTEATAAAGRTPAGAAPASGTNLETDRSRQFKITSANWNDAGGADLAHVRALVCPTPSTRAGSDCADRMLWMLGKIFDADPDTDPSSTTHWSIFDVLHSQPTVVTYGGQDVDGDGTVETFFDKVFFGTNDGGLHMLNAETGVEEWVFMPRDMLLMQPQLFTDAEGPHLYGLDLTATVRVFDADNDGIIDPNPADPDALDEFVHIYIGNRRGGDFLYALDITPNIKIDTVSAADSAVIEPKFLWRIEGGQGSYGRLGDTWSKPDLATIRLRSVGAGPGGSDEIVPRDVLIMGGGYDTALDTNFGTAPTGIDNRGNGIFIVDAETGTKLLDVTGTDGSDIVVPNLVNSFAAPLVVFDSDGDGFEDRIYAADAGGQVIRVDLGLDIKTTGGIDASTSINEGRTVVGTLASISTPGVIEDQRRFLTEPVVVQVKDEEFSDAANGEYDYVFIGTGNVADPLSLDVKNRFYAFRDRTVSRMTDADGDHLAEGYPAKSGVLTDGASISHANAGDLIDVTNDVLNSGNATHLSSTGWYFDFVTDAEGGVTGEKVVRKAEVVAGQLLFSSFQPYAGAPADGCSANIGQSRSFRLDVLSTAAVADMDEDGTLESLADRGMVAGSGIVSESGTLLSKFGIYLLQSSGTGFVGQLISGSNRTFRSYWTD